MQEMRDFTAFEAGLALLPGALVSGIMAPIIGRIFDKIGAKWLVITGLSILTLSTFAFTNLGIQTTFSYITIVYAIRMFGLVMVMMPIQTAALNQLPKHLIPHGAAMDNTMRMIAASVGTAILVTVMTTTEKVAEQNTGMSYPDIHGANVAFVVVAALSLLALIISLFIKYSKTTQKGKELKQSNPINVSSH